MQSQWRTLTLGVVLALAAVLAADALKASAQATDPRIGTWKMNPGKSKYDPGPAPQSLTVKVEPAGQGEKVTAEFVNADGTRATTVYTASFDGKDSPLTGSQIANTVALKRVDPRTTVRTDKKDGKVVQTLTRVVAPDGKTMTVTGKGTNAQGQAVNNLIVFDKQ